MTLTDIGRVCDVGCCRAVVDPEVDLATADIGDVHIRPMYEVLDDDLDTMGDAARWPEPYGWHDLDGPRFR